MTLLDKFRTQAPQKHADPNVRLAYVQELPIDERDRLGEMAREDADPKVRRAAVAKLMDPSALAVVVGSDPDEGVRNEALTMLRDIALDVFEGLAEGESLAAVEGLSDAKTLAVIAKSSFREEVALCALGRVAESHALGSIARHAQLEPIRLTALASLQDRAELVSVAINSDFKDSGVGAVERLEDRVDLEHVASRGKNKSAVKRARALLREMDERAAAGLLADTQVETSGVEAPAAGEDLAADDGREVEARAAEAARLDAEATAARERVELERQAARAREERDREAEAVQEQERQRAQAEDEERRRQEVERAAREREQEAEQAAAQARERQQALARLTQLAARLEPLAARGDLTLKAGERALRDVRAALADLPALPSKSDHDEIVRRLRDAQTALGTKVQELRELTEWRRWANLGVQEQLCAKMEALADVVVAVAPVPANPAPPPSVVAAAGAEGGAAGEPAGAGPVPEGAAPEGTTVDAAHAADGTAAAGTAPAPRSEDPAELVRQIRDLQAQWRAAGDAPRPQSDALWRRFKTAHDIVWERCEAHFAADARVRSQNLARKVTLCEQAEALADSTAWIQTAEQIKRLQAEWKSIGPVPRGQEKAIWERFRTPCDRFFTRRQADLAEHKKRWAANLEKKTELCTRVEALAESTEWETAAAEIRRLQNEWKTIGPVKRSRSEAIWRRFRGACDHFFTRYAQRHAIARGERVAAREAICAELEALDPAAPDLLDRTRAIRARWQQEVATRAVDRERAALLDQRFAAAFARLLETAPAVFTGSDFDLDANRKRMEALVRRVEDLAGRTGGSGGASDAALSPTARAAVMLREALAANTIGGRVDEESRLRAALEDVRQAQASWARIGPVSDEIRRPLADRFYRACRRITERSAPGRAEPRPRPEGRRPS